jgi:hypothetical protein
MVQKMSFETDSAAPKFLAVTATTIASGLLIPWNQRGPIRDCSRLSPSPLNGERAGVRGEKAQIGASPIPCSIPSKAPGQES